MYVSLNMVQRAENKYINLRCIECEITALNVGECHHKAVAFKFESRIPKSDDEEVELEIPMCR